MYLFALNPKLTFYTDRILGLSIVSRGVLRIPRDGINRRIFRFPGFFLRQGRRGDQENLARIFYVLI